MVRGDFSTLPVIDISELMARGAAASPRTVEAMGRAAREVGFFYVTGHGCPQFLVERLITSAAAFFVQDEARKMEVYIGKSRNHRGYVPIGEEVFAGGTIDKKEAFDLSLDLPVDDPAARAFPNLLGPNQWPNLPGFAHNVMQYYAAVLGIGRRLMQGFALALGQNVDFFDSVVTKPPSQLRLIHYPYNPEARDETGIGAHTDYECFTLLLATAPGLEVRNAAGAWIDAPPVPGAFVVNIGDLLAFWSGGAFAATIHRVRKIPAERYSFPLFFNVDYATLVMPLNGGEKRVLIAGDHLYRQTVQTFRYLQERRARGALVSPDGLSLDAAFPRHK